MGITRNSWHKRRATGGTRAQPHDKRKHELGRPSSNTKLAEKRIHLVRTRGGNVKHRGLRLNSGSFSWCSEGVARKVRILDVVYNASNNELVRTKTLVKGAIVCIDALPHRQWYENHYALPLARRKGVKLSAEEQENLDGLKKDGKTPSVVRNRQNNAAVEPHMVEQFVAGKLLARIASRPGQVGRCDGYLLEGKELDFYLRKLRAKKQK